MRHKHGAPERAASTKQVALSGVQLPQANARRLRGFIAINIGASVAFTAMYATQPVLPQIGKDFHVGAAQAGLTLLSVTFALAFASLSAGRLTDRFGSRRVMLACGAALTFFSYAVAFAPYFWLLVVLRTAQGLVVPGVTIAGLAFLHNELPASWRGRVSGLYIAANTLGGLLGRLGVGLSVEWIGWRGGLALVAVVVTVGFLILLLGMPMSASNPALVAGEPSNGAVPASHAPGQPVSAWRIFTRLWWAPLIGGTVFFPFLTVFTYSPYRLESPPFSLSASSASLFYLVYLIGAVVTPLAGRFSDRIGRRPTILGGLTISALGLAISLSDSLALALVALALVCAGSLAAHAVANASVSDSANPLGPHARATALALYTLGFYLGGGLGSFIPGFGWEHWGWPGVLAPCAVALLAAAFCSLCTPAHPRREGEAAPLVAPEAL